MPIRALSPDQPVGVPRIPVVAIKICDGRQGAHALEPVQVVDMKSQISFFEVVADPIRAARNPLVEFRQGNGLPRKLRRDALAPSCAAAAVPAQIEGIEHRGKSRTTRTGLTLLVAGQSLRRFLTRIVRSLV